MALLDRVEINPGRPAEYAVIWLHGLGADGHDFEPIVPELALPESLPVRFVFPHAPMRPVTINGGVVMRAWYDILDLPSRKVDVQAVLESAGFLQELIQRELAAGIASERIVLAGFSQGGAIVLHTGLRYDQPLAGILALSTYLPTAASLAEERSRANANIPILMAHGRHDPLIPISAAQSTRAALTQLDYSVQWHAYPMQHEVCMEEIGDIRAWIIDVLK
ncbi:MAG: carboxylesterase [Desulfobacteraceae bacterium]|nr:MAG: carboxylesterase [Desulfobacteraceae bacterium]